MKRSFTQSISTIIFGTVILFTNPIFAEPSNLTLVKNELKNYHDSGAYQKELTQVLHKAQKYIDQQAALNKEEKPSKKLAIVLDIDETSLSNYNSMIQRDFGGNRKQFHQDIMAANASAIKPMLTLYKDALHHHINVFFVTGRNESERQATEKNLIKAGYKQWTGLYLRPIDYTSKSIIPFKSQIRKTITEKGYTIIASIGDQHSDLKGGYTQRVFKLPNPYYYLP